MKFKIFLFLFCCISVLTLPQIQAQEHATMTYNIRYANENDGDNKWDNRKESLVKEILFYEPDFIGIQEGLDLQVTYLDQALSDYQYIGIGRKDGKTKGEYSAIFYHTKRVKLIESSTFWLSETPDQPSKGWDASLERICTYGKFQYLKRKKSKIWVFNTHFDHRGVEARTNSAQLILNKISAMVDKNEAAVLMGDFNLSPDSDGIQNISSKMQDSYTAFNYVPHGPSFTSTGFDINKKEGRRIDYIFGNDLISFSKTAVLSSWIDGRFNSDHFPIYSIFTIRK